MSTRLESWLRGYSFVATQLVSILLVLGVVNIAVALWPSDRERDEPAFVATALEQLYPDLSVDERAQLRNEFRLGFVPEVLAQPREAPVRGRFVEVDPNGFRRTRDQGAWPPAPDVPSVFLYGGSTAFGYGVPDDQSIASHLQPMLDAVPGLRGARVYNFGRGAYESTQERMQFQRRVLLGPTPDLAIFIDGLNDFVSEAGTLPLKPLSERIEADLRSPWRHALTGLPIFSLFETPAALFPVTAARKRAEPDPAVLDSILDRYLMNQEIIRRVARQHRVVPLFVWQPVPTYRYNLEHHVTRDFGGHARSGPGYRRLRERLRRTPAGSEFAWCADIQVGIRELLYVDRVHYSPDMSRRVARCIADAVAERWPSLSRNYAAIPN